MEQPQTVSFVDGAADGHEERSRASRRQRTIAQTLGETRPFDQLHREVRVAIDLAGLVDLDGVRMVDSRRRLGLRTESDAIGGAREIAPDDHFERDHAIEASLSRSIDDAHASAADLLEDLVVAEASRKRRRARRSSIFDSIPFSPWMRVTRLARLPFFPHGAGRRDVR